MPRASVDPSRYFGDSDFEQESANMVYDWMGQASQDKLVDFLEEVAPEEFLDEDGNPDEIWLGESSDFDHGEVFTAMWEGRTMADAGNLEAFEIALGLAEDHFDETILERLGRQ